MKIISYLPLMLVPLVAGCMPQTVDGCAHTTHITITPAKAAVSAAPEHICVTRGTTITVHVAGNFSGNPKKGSVSTNPKVPKDTWLSGSNALNAVQFKLFVNKEVKNGTYKYIVNTQGGLVEDPRVTVKDN